MKHIKVAIVGGAGYTAGELLRILIHHPYVEIAMVHSKSYAGRPLYAVHKDLLGDTDLYFTHELPKNWNEIDLLFLCLSQQESYQFLAENALPDSLKIIDLTQDFRDESRNFVYGLCEANRERIKQATRIANPGCFATCIELALLPLAKKQLLQKEVHISGITGATGAGRQLSEFQHFSWRNNNVAVYKPFEHQHLAEIRMVLSQQQGKPIPTLNFIPFRGNFSRGIFATLYTEIDLSLAEVQNIYQECYSSEPFVHISPQNLDLKQVIGTNKCFLYLEKFDNKLLIISQIDNLLKGASGQAVQNMNLMFGLPETTGLHLKSIAF
ncbi:MAG: N-acetyl-gamma-glutamyl-phosphate reductase [Microscillaceae bacterium]|nr:N-acetyl-gamma-glutamyl-phosphate reductase [Microscillaceae bacterium]MDW8461667.1 N-acetyl-gamma-glutamyl-phosphate reductase [Cytophagales bacterium]